MKRTALFALMISLLLGGCGAGAEDGETIRRWQESCRESEITFSASVMTQTEDTAFSYEARCECDEGETTVTLTAPANIAGVRFRTDGEDSALSYDGAELMLGEPGSALPPAMAVPAMMDAITGGYLRRTWREGGYLVAELETSQQTVTVWLENRQPVSVQIALSGYTAAQLQIDQWQQKEA